eukprot:scaffold26556_cov181-Cylindrotheca_fusiformis.AAC.1
MKSSGDPIYRDSTNPSSERRNSLPFPILNSDGAWLEDGNEEGKDDDDGSSVGKLEVVNYGRDVTFVGRTEGFVINVGTDSSAETDQGNHNMCKKKTQSKKRDDFASEDDGDSM